MNTSHYYFSQNQPSNNILYLHTYFHSSYNLVECCRAGLEVSKHFTNLNHWNKSQEIVENHIWLLFEPPTPLNTATPWSLGRSWKLRRWEMSLRRSIPQQTLWGPVITIWTWQREIDSSLLLLPSFGLRYPCRRGELWQSALEGRYPVFYALLRFTEKRSWSIF